MRRSLSRGKHPYWDRWFSIQDGVDEVAKFDELLLLDNDVYINEQAPDIFADWDSAKIGVVEESAQGPWDVPQRLPSLLQKLPTSTPSAVLPGNRIRYSISASVFFTDKNSHLFKALYEKWINGVRPRFTPDELRQKGVFFRYEADGPFLSYELQVARDDPNLFRTRLTFFTCMAGAGPNRATAFSIARPRPCRNFRRVLPRTMLAASFRSARSAMERALQECHFLHIAGSKSPLWLLPN